MLRKIAAVVLAAGTAFTIGMPQASARCDNTSSQVECALRCLPGFTVDPRTGEITRYAC
jgi:hypothetical protein